MKKLWFTSAALVALSGSMFADGIYAPASTGNFFTTGPTSGFCCTAVSPESNSTNLQTPFWNNYSGDNINSDGNHTNVGDVLAGSATGTNLIGGNLSGTATVGGNTTTVAGTYYAITAAAGGDPAGITPASGAGATDQTPSLEFSFMSSATAYNIALLFADSGLNGGTGNAGGPATSFGTYILNTGSGCSGFCVFTPVDVIDSAVQNNTSGTAQSLTGSTSTLAQNGFVYGFYATVCYAFTGPTCTASVTYTSGAGNFSTNITAGSANAQFLGGLDWNHFALFDLSANEYVLGFEDSPWALSNANATEGEGDFNDVMISLTSAAGVPEPGTIAIMGLGLAGLGLIGRRRFAKK
jgi:hypothetical protein